MKGSRVAPQSTLTIAELGERPGCWDLRLEMAGTASATVTVTVVNPAGPREEDDLRRCLEKHLALAIIDPGSTRRAAAMIPRYGAALHAQLRSTPEARRILDLWSSAPGRGPGRRGTRVGVSAPPALGAAPGSR